MSGTWVTSWNDALARLELDADRAEQLIRDGRLLEVEPEPWEPPSLGPLPTDLVTRAHSILDRHTAVAAELAHAARENRQHASMLSRIDGGPAGRLPVYVDQSA